MRLAAIDIGTNSLHMIVVRIRADFSFEVIDREKDGAPRRRPLDGRALTPEAMHAALQVMSSSSASPTATAWMRLSPSPPARPAKPRTAASFSRDHRAHRHPRARHLGHRRSPVHPRRRMRRRPPQRHCRGRHRRRQRGDSRHRTDDGIGKASARGDRLTERFVKAIRCPPRDRASSRATSRTKPASFSARLRSGDSTA